MNVFKIKRVLILVIIIIISHSVISSQNSNDTDRLKKWKLALENEPLPKNAIELKEEYFFPSDKDENEGRFLSGVSSIALDRRGKIYCSDWKLNKIIIIDRSNRSYSEYALKGQGPGELQYPRDILLDDGGNIFVNNTGNGRIDKFSNDLKYLSSFKIYKNYKNYCMDTNGLIYVNYLSRNFSEENLIEIIDQEGRLVRSFGKRKEFIKPNIFQNETFLAMGKDGSVYALWRTINILRKFTTDGKMQFETKINDTVYDDISNENMSRINPNNGPMTYRHLAGGFCFNNGKLYVLRIYPRLIIYELSETGKVERIFWVNTPFGYQASSLIVRNENDKFKVYTVQLYPEMKIEIYTN